MGDLTKLLGHLNRKLLALKKKTYIKLLNIIKTYFSVMIECWKNCFKYYFRDYWLIQPIA